MSERVELCLCMAPPYGPEMPPLSLACLAESAREAGFETRVLDLNIRAFRSVPLAAAEAEWSMDHKEQWVWPTRVAETCARYAEVLDAGVEELAAIDARTYGFSVHSDNRLVAQAVIRRLKKKRPDAIIVVGGMGVYSDTGRRAFEAGLVDAFSIGPEGETTMIDVLRARREGRPLSEVPGLVLWTDGAWRPTAERATGDINAYPYPTFSDFDLAQYTTPNLPVVTSRGCRSHCLFCNDRVLMGQFRGRGAESVFHEIRHHVESLGVRDFSFNDLQLNYNVTEIDRLCTLLNEWGEKIRWNANIIVSESFQLSILNNMRAAGCHTLTLGLESGSGPMIKKMAKGFKLDTARRLMRDIKTADITLWVNLVVGFPGETDATVDETIAFVTEHADVIDEICVCNTCNLLEYSTLAENRDRLGIAPAKSAEWDEVSWALADGTNTFEIRMEWLGRMVAALRKHDLPIRQTNYHFRGEDHLGSGPAPDVVLAICPPADTRFPPLELTSVAAYLRAKGVIPTCLDLNIDAFRKADEAQRVCWAPGEREKWADPVKLGRIMPAAGQSADEMAVRMLTPGTSIVAVYAELANALVTRVALEALKRLSPAVRVVVFGPSTAIAAERSLFTEDLCDAMVIGEVEGALLDVCRRMLANEPLGVIRGVRYVKPDGSPHFIPREPIKDMDTLPRPEYRELRPERYSPVLGIRASRGCVHRCAFCAQQPAEGPARWRSPQSVLDEMDEAFRVHGVRAFTFTDLIINGDFTRLAALCDLLIAARLPLTLDADIAPDARNTPELFEKMKAAGFRALRFGVENFVDPVLKAMNKRYDARTAAANLRDAHAAGLEVHINMMVGYPGESYEDFYTNLRWLKKVEPFVDYVDTINACRVLPSTKLERHPGKYQVLLPPKEHALSWSFMGYNNENYRDTRVKETAVWAAGLDVRFHYDHFVHPGGKFRRDEGRIRARIAERVGRETECVIVNMPPWGFTNPPVGPAVLATYLDSRGHPTQVLDYNARWYNEAPENQKLLWHVENKNFWSNDFTWEVMHWALREKIDKAADEILAQNPKLVGFSVVDPKERVTVAVIEAVRKRSADVTIVLGGPAIFTPDYRTIFFDRAGKWIDGYVVGEGEETLLDCVRAVQDGRPLKGIPGVITLGPNGEQELVPRGPIADLDSVPYPTYRHFDMNHYHGQSLVLEWSRGCVAHCVYCKGKDLAGKYRSRSAKHIFEELKYHVEVLGYSSFTVSDNILNGRPKVLHELCDLIIEAKLPIRWNAEAAPMKNLTPELLRKLRAAGCFELQLGLEVGSDAVLKLMQKDKLFTIESASQVFKDAKEAGIKTCMFCIVGFPGETEEDFQKTLAMIERNAPYIDQVKSINACVIITGTDLHVQAGKFGMSLPKNDYHYLWTDGNGLAIEERNDRIRRVLALVQKLGKECLETNLTEGKQLDLEAAIRAGGMTDPKRQWERLIQLSNNLGSFDPGDYGDGKSAIKVPTLAEDFKRSDAYQPAPVDAITIMDRTYDRASFAEAARAAGTNGTTKVNGVAAHTAPGESIAAPKLNGKVDRVFVEKNLHLAGVLSGEKVYAGPKILEVDLTNRCNLNCVGCWNHGFEMGDARWTGEMFRRTLPTKTVLATIDEAAAAGATTVQLSGAGDPLLHPDFLKVLERIKSHGLRCMVITNGTMLTTKIMRRMVELGLDSLTVSVWAGSEEMYKATHPGTKPKMFGRIRDALREMHALKKAAGRTRPHVKIYNVVSHANAGGIDDMITFALDALVDHVEFTPVDIVPGRSDALALTSQDRELIKTQLDGLTRRDDYLELDPAQGPRSPGGTGEGKEFARFVKYAVLPHDFRYELDDITRFDVLCARKAWRLDIREDNKEHNALFFQYPKDECVPCPMRAQCSIDKEHHRVKVEFLSVLGFGPFYRRITSPDAHKGEYDAAAIRDIACNIGWTYARVGTDGKVAPCCKGTKMPMGSVQNENLRAVWTRPEYVTFRRNALTKPKDDPFFAPIACMKACDNLGMIRTTQSELDALGDAESGALRQPEAQGFKELRGG